MSHIQIQINITVSITMSISTGHNELLTFVFSEIKTKHQSFLQK